MTQISSIKTNGHVQNAESSSAPNSAKWNSRNVMPYLFAGATILGLAAVIAPVAAFGLKSVGLDDTIDLHWGDEGFCTDRYATLRTCAWLSRNNNGVSDVINVQQTNSVWGLVVGTYIKECVILIGQTTMRKVIGECLSF